MAYSFPFEKLEIRGPITNDKSYANEPSTGSMLSFKHPNIDNNRELIIKTGADRVEWGYSLNTNRIPTYGGEVVQILSMAANTLTVGGTVRNYKEQTEIYRYFFKYIKLAGGMGGSASTNERVQTPIIFSYPARGWSFEIIVTSLDEMIQDVETVAPRWGFTAEIVSENERYEIGNAILSGMSTVLSSREIIANVGTDGVIGFKANNPFSGPLTSNPDQFGSILDERLQQQIGSWVTDSYSTYLFQDAITSNSDTSFKSSAEYYTAMFGTDVAFTVKGGEGTGADNNNIDNALSSLSGTLTAAQVAALAYQGFVDQEYLDSPPPAWDKNLVYNSTDIKNAQNLLITAVSIAAAESSFNTHAIHHNVTGDDPPNPTYEDYINNHVNDQPNSDPTVESYDLGLWQINTIHKDAKDKPGNRQVKDHHRLLLDDPLYNARIMASVSQGGKSYSSWVTSYNGKYKDYLNQARDGVKEFLLNPEKYLSTIGTKLTGSIASQAVQIAKAFVNYADQVTYSTGSHGNAESFYSTYQSWEDAANVLQTKSEILNTDCSGFVSLLFMWAGAGKGMQSSFTMQTLCKSIYLTDGGNSAQLDNVSPGDIAIWSNHVEIVTEAQGSGINRKFTTIGNGSNNDPKPSTPILGTAKDIQDQAGTSGRKFLGFYRWPGVK